MKTRLFQQFQCRLNRSVGLFALVMLSICGAALPAAAQVETGSVAGTVKDAQSGVIPGATKVWKFNTYGITRKQAQHLAGAFVEIARENRLKVNE